MSALQIIFLVIGAATLVAAVLVVSTRKIMHAALWLIAALLGVAVLFALLEAGFFTAVQVVVYIGAIAILIIFAVMLTRRSMDDIGPQVNKNWPWALAVSVVGLGGLIFTLSRFHGFNSAAQALPAGGENLDLLGQALVGVGSYLIPFEVASVLLIAALVGAIYIAGEPKK